MVCGRHLGFDRTGNRAVRSAVPENPTQEPNTNWIGWRFAELWPFEVFQNGRSRHLGINRRPTGNSAVRSLIFRSKSHNIRTSSVPPAKNVCVLNGHNYCKSECKYSGGFILAYAAASARYYSAVYNSWSMVNSYLWIFGVYREHFSLVIIYSGNYSWAPKSCMYVWVKG